MKKTLIALVSMFCLASCFTATINEDSICKTTTFTASAPSNKNIPSGIPITLPPIKQTVDLSDTIGKFSNVGSIAFALTRNTLTIQPYSFDWVKHITITVESANNIAQYPQVILSNQDVFDTYSILQLNYELDDNTMYSYLSQGPVTFGLIFTGYIPQDMGGVNLSQTICASVNVNVSKHL